MSGRVDSITKLRKIRKENNCANKKNTIIELIQSANSANELEKIGHLLRDMTVKDWGNEKNSDVTEVKIAILSNFTCNSMAPYLRALMLEHNLWPTIYLADFNQYHYELLNPDSQLYSFHPDVTLCLLDEHIFLDELHVGWNSDNLNQLVTRKIAEIRSLLNTYTEHCEGVMIVNTFPISANTYDSFLDYKNKARLSIEWRKFEIALFEISEELKQCIVIDSNILVHNIQSSTHPDPRLYYYAHLHMNENMFLAFTVEIVKIVRANNGLNKKCLVLDLDNTLWGGIVGDDGIEGIKLGNDYPGNVFVDFQRKIKHLKEQGILLTICSKNDIENVYEVLDSHPDMVLNKEDFVRIYANWEPKHVNIEKIAKSLNIGIDSLVFIDDNPFEREMVRNHLDHIAVPEISEESANYVRDLLSTGWFNTLELTEEDKKRTNNYKQQEERQIYKNSTTSIDDYLHGLDIQLTILHPDQFTLPRLTQLNLRTNQFNLTTRRYQQTEMENMVKSGEYIIRGFQAKDKFGDYGIIASVILQKDFVNNERTIWIRNILMSCRVFSRGIETAIINEVMKLAREKGVKQLYGEYIPTKKNEIVKDFYKRHGFQSMDDTSSHLIFVNHLQLSLNEVPWITIHSKSEELVTS